VAGESCIVTGLADAWRAWEARPGNAEAANEMEDCCAVAAAVAGRTTTQFRSVLIDRRRDGDSMRGAIESLLGADGGAA
jgi:hypothetical protein